MRSLIAKYVPPLEARDRREGRLQCWSSNKDVVIDGRKKSELYFASVIPQKGYVGFYYMPVYTNPERKKLFEPELLSLLKGKSCFYVRRARSGAEAADEGRARGRLQALQAARMGVGDDEHSR